MYRNTCVEVNLSNLSYNVKTLIKRYNTYKYYFGVVKADSYGHNDIATVKTIIDAGCNYLCVATLDEALTIRKEINSRCKKIYKAKTGEEKDGADLMNNLFSANKPLLMFEDNGTETGRNVQLGYMQILAGSMTGIRNPKAHENQNVTKDSAYKRLMLASLLMDKIDEAEDYERKNNN